jgi:hypothetical protein
MKRSLIAVYILVFLLTAEAALILFAQHSLEVQAAQVVSTTPVLGACSTQSVPTVGIITACFLTDPAFPERQWIVVATGSGFITITPDYRK